jgi:hypothetical protein
MRSLFPLPFAKPENKAVATSADKYGNKPPSADVSGCGAATIHVARADQEAFAAERAVLLECNGHGVPAPDTAAVKEHGGFDLVTGMTP